MATTGELKTRPIPGLVSKRDDKDKRWSIGHARVCCIFSTLITVFMLFPYSPPITNSYTQPLAPLLLVVFMFFIASRSLLSFRLKKTTLVCIGVLVLLLLVQMLKLEEFGLDYLTISKYLLALGFFWFGYNWLGSLDFKIVYIALLIWAASILIQIVSPSFFLPFVSGQKVSAGRGLLGLAPEPSHLAIHMALCFFLLTYWRKMKDFDSSKYSISLGIVFLGLLFSQSGSAAIILVLVTSILMFDIANRKPALVVPVMILTIFAFWMFFFVMPSDRTLALMELVQSRDFLQDASLNTRLFHNSLGLNVIMEGKILGYSSNAFSEQGLNMFENVPEFVHSLSAFIDKSWNGKLHSTLATFLFDFGFVAILVVFLAIFKLGTSSYFLLDKNLFTAILVVLMFLTLFMLPIPVGSPIFFATLGLYCTRSKSKLRYHPEMIVR